MLVRSLTLADFRNYSEARIELGAGTVVLTGENGAGKTNILEAVSLLAPGRGLRRAALPEMAGDPGAGGFAMAATLAASRDSAPDLTIGTATTAATPARRLVSVNGAAMAASRLGEWLSVLWLTPAMDRLFAEGAGGRRRFFDRLALALRPGHAMHAARYEAAMRARNRLLGEPGQADRGWLDALETQMAKHGAEIDSARRDLVTALGDRLEGVPTSPFAKPELRIASAGLGTANDLQAALASGRVRDARAGRTLTGPHRDDFIVTHAAKQQPADRCSTGEQKALLLSLVLAHGDLVAERRGDRPILLLDEIAAHLDPARRAALFERLEAGGGQVWMTGTEPDLFASVVADATRLKVADGVVREL